MAVWSEISNSQLAASHRLDAEYYQPRYLADAKRLAKIGLNPIGSFAFVTDGIHASPDVVEEDGILYLSAKCIKDNTFALVDALQISKAQHAANPRTSLRENDVLITTVGTIGNAAVVQRDILPANADRHLGIIRIHKDSKVDPYYLATFLNSEYGLFQSLREATGNVQLNLFIEKIKELNAPLLPCADKVATLTREAYEKHKEAAHYIEAAEKKLTEVLGLSDLVLSSQKCYSHKFSELQAEARFDAEYFSPKYQRIIKRLRETILPAPELSARWIHEQKKALAVCEFVGLLLRVRALDCGICQSHGHSSRLMHFGGMWGYRNWGYRQYTPKYTPNRTWLPWYALRH